MKNILFTTLLVCSFMVKAQITLNQSHFAKIGDTLFFGYDTNNVASDLTITGGANRTWDFSGKAKNITSQTVFYSPTRLGGQAPPDATLVLVDGSPSETSFLKVTTQEVQTIVNNPVYNFLGGDEFINIKSISFPLTYLTRTRDTVSNRFVIAASTLGIPLFDSVRITYNIRIDVLCDGWGTLKTPTNDYANTLRLKSTRLVNFNFEGKTNTLPIWINIPLANVPIPVPDNETTTNFIWLSEGSKYFLAEATMVTDDDLTQEEYRYQIPRSGANGLLSSANNAIRLNTYPNPSNTNFEIAFTTYASQLFYVEVTDITGKVVSAFSYVAQSGNNTISISTTHLANGFYTVKLKSNTQVGVSKVLVQH